ncbi:MAG: radical SAM family heme chaperone HemW [Flavobacteriales bacterium]
MSGIYFHIPFCRKACHYCDFHFSTQLSAKERMVAALISEVNLSKDFITEKTVETIYFGGGTPSVLSAVEITSLIAAVRTNFEVVAEPEITLESNPDDLTPEYLVELKRAGINRLSIGIQSFFDDDLERMNRSHNAEQAKKCVQLAHAAGISNITIDLIYGMPYMDEIKWKENLQYALRLPVQHISSYCLTVENRTVLHHKVKQGEIPDVDEDMTLKHFEILMEETAKKGFEHYEISNFALPGFRSRHNSSYWWGKQYLGIGPSAHSYNESIRRWNLANNTRYLKAIEADEIPCEEEILTPKDKLNEYLLTRIRLTEGCNFKDMKLLYYNKLPEETEDKVDAFCLTGLLEKTDTGFRLTQKGKFRADGIAAELFVTN